MGYDVVETTKSPDALEAFRSHPDLFDLVLTDQTMPRLSGVDLITKVREIRPEIPVILMTGYSEIVGPERAAELGVGEFLMKPVTSGELGEAVARALSSARIHG
jgi:DNA-binding NtrC family response regulator